MPLSFNFGERVYQVVYQVPYTEEDQTRHYRRKIGRIKWNI